MTTEVISTKGSFDSHEFYKKSRAEKRLKRKQKIQDYVNKFSAQQLADMAVTAFSDLEDMEAQHKRDEHNKEMIWREFKHFTDVFWECYR